VKLSAEEKEKIDKLFTGTYGRTVPYEWHRLYQSYTGEFQEAYFPEYLFSSKFEPKVNPRAYRYVLDDKLILPLFVSGEQKVRIPKTMASYCNGIYFDAMHQTMTVEQLAKRLSNGGKMVIKETQDTSSGRGVKLLNIHNGKDENGGGFIDILKTYSKRSFVIQEVLSPCAELNALNPSSINTFRVVTYLWNGAVHHWPVALRIGRNGNFLDNAHAGGMFIYVSDDGFLGTKAFTEFQDVFEVHPDTHMRFEGYHFSFFPELIEVAERMHLNAPQLGVISWDLTVDENYEFVLIEANTQGQTIWFPQMASGKPAFGDNTGEILGYIGTNKG
jgi:hypothetical protein